MSNFNKLPKSSVAQLTFFGISNRDIYVYFGSVFPSAFHVCVLVGVGPTATVVGSKRAKKLS